MEGALSACPILFRSHSKEEEEGFVERDHSKRTTVVFCGRNSAAKALTVVTGFWQ
jgi:hypothetical protein